MSLQSAVSNTLARKGAAYTLWRNVLGAGPQAWKPGTVTPGFYPCRARARRFDPRKVAGTISETEGLIIVDASTLSIVPAKGDRIARGTYATNEAGAVWYHVTDVDAPEDGGARPVYRLKVSQ